MTPPPIKIDLDAVKANAAERGARRDRERDRRAALGRSVYRPALVAFLDILGFREIIKSRTAADVGAILALVQKMHISGDEEDETPDAGEPGVIAFSDSIVRVIPVDPEEQSGAMYYELTALALAQAELAVLGVFIRGGVAFDDIVFDGRTIFGPALVTAYEVEDTLADVPRIMLAPGLVALYRKTPALWGDDHTLAEDFAAVRRLIFQDGDGQWAVDYLRVMAVNLDPGVSVTQLLTRHRDKVLEAAARCGPKTGVRAKYEWLIRYHNGAVASLRPHGVNDPLLIKATPW